jgi:hypothetical protein
MNVKIGTLAVLFLFWVYLFPIIGIGSLQCGTLFLSTLISCVSFEKLGADCQSYR